MTADGRHIVLLGAGHAHVEVLRRFAAKPARGARITLVTPVEHVPYTGMAPGTVSGRYSSSDASIDAAALGRAAGATVILTRAEAIDALRKTVRLENQSSISYEILSIDVGGRIMPRFEAAADGPRVLGVKPVEPFLAAVEAAFAAAASPRIIVAGGGHGGVELAAALAARGARTTLVAGAAGLLDGDVKKARRLARKQLAALGVRVVENVRVVGSGRDADGAGVALLERRAGAPAELPAELIVLATGVAPPALLASVPALLDETGFLRINAYLQSAGDQAIYAAGDCSSFAQTDDGSPLPKAGVHAVRQGPLLAANLRAAVTGAKKRWYDPQEKTLAILSFHPKGAVAIRGRMVFSGSWVSASKTLIDRRFVARYRSVK